MRMLLFLLFFVYPALSYAQVSLDRMVGSMIMCGFRGETLTSDDPFFHSLASGHVGHVLIFDRDVATRGPRNIRSKAQLTALLSDIRHAAGHPLLIAVDQEGGRVARLKPVYGFAHLPSPKEMGAGKTEATRNYALHAAKEMRAVGITVDFAPSVDVASSSNSLVGSQGRCFGRKSQDVVRHGLAFSEGLALGGVIPTLKHFPGIGCAKDDSHVQRMDVSDCFDETVDLAPYRAAFASGWRGMVMVGHAQTPYDAVYPASLSRAVIEGLLRGKLGFDGVVVSDDLQMGAILDYYTLDDAVRLAVLAGADILLFGNNLHWRPDMGEKAYESLRRQVESGAIPKERIERSYARIQALIQANP